VLDTAPTGHTLLLLDATKSYHREVAKNSDGVSEEVKELLPHLRDLEFTKILLVTLPEATPVHEAARCRTICDGRKLSPSPGSSTRASPYLKPPTRFLQLGALMN
jgi:arsenite-transporting ATPase